MTCESGYIVDKTPNFEKAVEYDGSTLLTQYGATDPDVIDSSNKNWMSLVEDGYTVNNYISDNAYVLIGDFSGNRNMIRSPYHYSARQIDDYIHFSVDVYVDSSTSSEWTDLRLYFDSIDTEVSELVITGTSTGIELEVLGVGTAAYTCDLNSWNRLNVFLIDGVWKVYFNDNYAGGLSSDGTTANGIAQMEIENNGTYNIDIHVKNLIMRYNTTFRDGYNNLQSSIVEISSAEAGSSFPIVNLTNSLPNKPCVFVTNEIEVTMYGENPTVTFLPDLEMTSTHFAILGHNFTRSAVITISYGDSLSTLTTENINWSSKEIIHEFSSEVTAAYYVLRVIDLDNPNNLIIGEVLLGKPYEFSENFFWQVEFQNEYNNITHKTDFLAKWTYHLNSIKSVSNIDFSMITDETVIELFDLFEAAEGSRYPILFFWDTRTPDLGIIYGNLTDKYKRVLTFINVNEVRDLVITGLPYAKAITDDIT